MQLIHITTRQHEEDRQLQELVQRRNRAAGAVSLACDEAQTAKMLLVGYLASRLQEGADRVELRNKLRTHGTPDSACATLLAAAGGRLTLSGELRPRNDNQMEIPF